MKSVKVICLLFVICFIPIILLNGCATDRPADKQILNDLTENLTVHNDEEYYFDFEIAVDEFAVETSMSGENMYTASMVAIVNNDYADYYWPVEVKYIKHDQAWSLLNCEWGEYTYEQVRYPSKSEIKGMVEELGLSTSISSEIIYEAEKIIYNNVKLKSDWSKFASGTTTCNIIWRYSQSYDVWEYLTTQNTEENFVLSKELEGKWKLESYNNEGDMGYMIIENVTETGLDVSAYGWHKFPKTHFEITSGNIGFSNGETLSITCNGSLHSRSYFEIFTITLFKDPTQHNGKDLSLGLALGSYATGVTNESSKVE